MRLNKYISQSGYCSRRHADLLIEEGLVTINGKKASKGDQVKESDHVKVEGRLLKTGQERKIYLAFNKPVGVIVTMDKNAKDSILKYINVKERVFPIGRLDVASSGLILLTNDGDFAQKITHAKHRIEKEYIVKLNKVLSSNHKDILENGVVILGRKTAPCVIRKGETDLVSIILTQGRNRQIRRMFDVLGYKVVMLKRIRIGNIILKELKPGKTRFLLPKEISFFSKQKY